MSYELWNHHSSIIIYKKNKPPDISIGRFVFFNVQRYLSDLLL